MTKRPNSVAKQAATSRAVTMQPGHARVKREREALARHQRDQDTDI